MATHTFICSLPQEMSNGSALSTPKCQREDTKDLGFRDRDYVEDKMEHTLKNKRKHNITNKIRSGEISIGKFFVSGKNGF